MSTNRTNRIHAAIITSRVDARLLSRDSSRKNGTKKWKRMRKMARYCQPWFIRAMKYGSSSIRFAA